MTFKKKRRPSPAPDPMEGARPNFPPGVLPDAEDAFPEAGRQTVLLSSRRRGIKKAPIALAAATVASMFAAGWGTTAQAQEITDAKGAPMVTAQQAKVAGEVAEEVARREQDPANDSWIGKALASILEGDVVPFVTLADAMLAGVGGENLAQASGDDESSKTEAEDPASGGPEKEQGDSKAQGADDEHAQADGSPPERANPGGTAEDTVEESAQSLSEPPSDKDDSSVGGAEKPTAEQDSDSKPESDEPDTLPDGSVAGTATRTEPASSGGSGSEVGSSGSEQADTHSSDSFSSPFPVEGTKYGDDATPDDSGDALSRSGQIPNASSSEATGGGYVDDASGSVLRNVGLTYEEGPFGFAPAEDGEPPEGTSDEEIGASDESKEAVENYLENGEEKYLKDSLERNVEDKTNPAEPGLSEGEGNYSAESYGEDDEGQALGEGSGFGGTEESDEAPSEQEAALEDTSSAEVPGVERELPAEGFEAAGLSGGAQFSRSGVPEALREFLEAVEQSQSAQERSEVEREAQEQAPSDDFRMDVLQGAVPTAARPDGRDPEGESDKTPLAGDGFERNTPTYAPVVDQEQPEKEEPQDASASEKREEVSEQDRQQPVEWTRASDREQAQPQEQQSSRPREENASYAAPPQARHLEEPKQHGAETDLETDGTGSLNQSIPVLGTGPSQGEPSDPGGVLDQKPSALSSSQEGPSTVDNDRFGERSLDGAANSTPRQVTVDGVDSSGGISGPEDAGVARQSGGFDSDDGGGPSWRLAGEDLPSTPVRPAPDQEHASSFEPEIRNLVADGADQVGDGASGSNERGADKG